MQNSFYYKQNDPVFYVIVQKS